MVDAMVLLPPKPLRYSPKILSRCETRCWQLTLFGNLMQILCIFYYCCHVLSRLNVCINDQLLHLLRHSLASDFRLPDFYLWYI